MWYRASSGAVFSAQPTLFPEGSGTEHRRCSGRRLQSALGMDGVSALGGGPDDKAFVNFRLEVSLLGLVQGKGP